jgi:TatD DNase family protein
MQTPLLVDSHCHLDRLDLSPYQGDVDVLLEAAHDAGVGHFLCIGVDLETFPRVQALAETYDNVHASVGVHPLYKDSMEPTVDELVRLAAHPKVVAVGETGLDYFYAKENRAWQQARFVTHIRAARQAGLPVVVHTRGARQDTLSMLRDEGQGEVTGVLHCFTEDLPMAEAAMALGFYISISGIVTFNNAQELRDVVRALPLDRLLLETDAPWLAPVPHRGKKNEPKYVREVAQCVADLKRISVEELAAVTGENFFTLFSKARSVT